MVYWRHARTSPYGDVFTYWALAEIVKAQAGILETDRAAVARDKLRRAVNDAVSSPEDVARIEPHLHSLVGFSTPPVTHGDERQDAFVAWRRFFEAVALEHTLVLVFEDVHWADPGLLDFIEHVLEWARDVRILILCTARPEFVDVRPDWGKDRKNTTTIALTPLSSDETGELVAMLAPSGVPDETRAAIVGAAAGNPLFAVEFVRMLVDRPDRPPAAESVRAVIAARLDALSTESKLLLQDAAVVGRILWPGVLVTIGDRTRRGVDDQLGELVEKEFLSRSRGTSVAGETEFEFRHVLVRDAAYDQIPRARRAEIHRRVAEWLDSLSPDRTTDRAEMLAFHYLAAYEYALAANADVAELAEGARLALRNAAERALALNAFDAAVRHFRAAIDLWPADDPERPELLLRLGQSMYYVDRQGEDVFSEAEGALLAAGDRESAAEAAMFLARLAHQSGQSHERVFEHADRALELLTGCGASRAKVEVLIDRANYLALDAEHDEAIRLATEALQDAETLGLLELQADALSMIGFSRGVSGDPGGRADLERSVAIMEEIGSSGSAHCYGMLADLEGSLGHLDRCFSLQESARGHAERFGLLAHIQWLKAERVAECYWRGEWQEAIALADEFLAEVQAGSGHFMEPYCHATRGRIALARGDLASALDDTATALADARHSEAPQMLCPALAVRARALIASEAHDEAAQVVDELLALWRDKLNLFLASAWVVDLVWALDRLGRGAELLELAGGVRARTAWLEAATACASGKFDTAADLLAGIGSAPDEALARLRSAQARAGSGIDADGRRDLELAVAFFREVDASAYLRECEAVLVG